MSFSFDTKTELCRLAAGEKCCAVAECYGMLLYGNTFSAREIRIITGNKLLGQRIASQFSRAFSILFDIVPEPGKSGKQPYMISNSDKLGRVFETYGFSPGSLLAHHVNLGVLEEECCRRSFIRGAFLTGGSITDPSKSYHLELVTDHYSVSREMYSLLLDTGFYPKEAVRGGNYVTYFKQSSAIEDFLTLMGAPLAAMELMSAKIEKDMRNSINRKVNCDTANVTKTVDAATAQIGAIKKIDLAGELDALPEKLKQTAFLRLQNPELSIKELAEISIPPVTKSCLSHRLRKLTTLSDTL
ncbi:MAG: DNA-binding protein WhiA [Oscillospiraceae bacterium]|jgi:DNA-binding protein WhiA|nr:DNA-binding protein WhiA [Oscillospiraceae bacterium]